MKNMEKIKSLLKIISLGALLIFTFSCSRQSPPKEELINNGTAVILNQMAESLSLYNFKTGEYKADAITLHGAAPRGLFYNAPSTHAFIASSTANHVEVFDIIDGKILYNRSISMPPSCSPYDVHDFGDEDIFYVTCSQTGQFLKVSLKDDRVVKKPVSNLVGPQAFGMNNNKIYVIQTGFGPNGYDDGTITVVDKDLTLLGSYPMKGLKDPQDLVFLPGNMLHILVTGGYSVLGSQEHSSLAVYSLDHLSSPQKTIDLGENGYISFAQDQDGRIYLYGYTDDILSYEPNKMNLSPFFSMGDFKGHSGSKPQGIGFYKSSIILSLGDFNNYNDILVGEKDSIRSNYKKLKASAGTSTITMMP